MRRSDLPAGKGSTRALHLVALLCATTAAVAGCGGGSGGGGGPGGGGGDLSLVHFSLDGLDQVPVNRTLFFQFTCAVDPESVTNASIQIRAGEAFGRSVRGTYTFDGAAIRFLPQLSEVCRFADADYGGLLPGTKYRVTVVGHPEEFCLRAESTGHPLVETCAFEFRTCEETDPDLFEDDLPGQVPKMSSSLPESGSIAVAVRDDNEIRVQLSENVDPCSVTWESVRFHVYETGDPATMIDVGDGRASGFAPPFDSADDPYSWGSKAPGTKWAPAQRIPSTIVLRQDHDSTEVIVTPIGGRFPENSLVVLDLTHGIQDFAGSLFYPATIAFTTENQPRHERVCLLEFEGETPILGDETTADVDTARSEGRAQGWLIFAGDGDNGTDPLLPGEPYPCSGQHNDGIADDFDPSGSVLFDTGGVPNSCVNDVDGSTAAVWEFDSFRLQTGLQMRFVGANPAIILVRGDVVIEEGAFVRVKGSNLYDTPPIADGQFRAWTWDGSMEATARGGQGVAGGGDGGDSDWGVSSYGQDGVAGAGSPEEYQIAGHGAGLGGVALLKPVGVVENGGGAGGGGGGGHEREGADGLTEASPLATHKGPTRSDGGERYWAGSDSRRLLQASAGSGGGGAGYLHHEHAAQSGHAFTGGAGGAGGGFLAIICGGDMTISGTIDASGGTGGEGRGLGLWSPNGLSEFGWAGAGGGGAGGGLLLVTPRQLRITSSATISAAGGAGGLVTGNLPGPKGHGGNGSVGRIVLEDGDSVVPGLGAANVVPGEGERGFWRGVFDPTRFRGPRQCRAVTEPFYVGGFAPTFLLPAASDFLGGVPAEGAPGTGATAILIEVRGYPLLRKGTPDLDEVTSWYVVGYFEDTALPQEPLWWCGQEPSDVTRASDCAGPDLTKLNAPGGLPYLQVRLTFYLSDHIGPFDPGPYLDQWKIRFEEDL